MKKRKKIIYAIVALVVVALLVFVFGKKKSTETIQKEQVKKQNIEATVLATGQVVSVTDLSLAFKASGIVQRIPVTVGQQVKAGDILAGLSARDQAASLTTARGAVAQAKANLEKVLAGASSEEVIIAQVAVNNAEKSLQDTKSQQAVLVANARQSLLNSTIAAVPGVGNISSATISISGSYTGTEDATYLIKFYSTGNGLYYSVNGPGGGSGYVTANIPLVLSNTGLYFTISGTTVSTNDQWTVTLPNTQASNYTANLNAYNSSLQTQNAAVSSAQSVLDSALANLNLKKAQARPADIAAAKAQILSAEGQLQAASASLENTIIRAPANGTITKIDTKVGQQATALQPLVVLQDTGNLHIEANVSEANVASVKIGQPVKITFDALGQDKIFEGTVVAVDPASTVVSGVVNYKVTFSFKDSSEIKPGMTANLIVSIASKQNVLAVPSRAVVGKDGKKYVRVVTNEKNNTYEEKEITTGLEADGGLVEITGGVNEGQTVVTYITKK